MNFSTQTRLERLHNNKETFKKLLPITRYLTPKEQRAFVHLLLNKDRAAEKAGSEINPEILDMAVDKELEKALAKVSEEENYNLKNRYRFQKHTMNFADKKRMPVDERKVKDLLRNQHIFRHKINSQIGTYTQMQNNP